MSSKVKSINERCGKDRTAGALRWEKLRQEKERQHQEASDGTIDALKPLTKFLRRKEPE